MKTCFRYKDLGPKEIDQVRKCYTTFCPNGWNEDDLRELTKFLDHEHKIKLRADEIWLVVDP